ncbi:MAG: hypothetical protein QXE66_00820 [Desulfurococcaceae archaeon]
MIIESEKASTFEVVIMNTLSLVLDAAKKLLPVEALLMLAPSLL